MVLNSGTSFTFFLLTRY